VIIFKNVSNEHTNKSIKLITEHTKAIKI